MLLVEELALAGEVTVAGIDLVAVARSQAAAIMTPMKPVSLLLLLLIALGGCQSGHDCVVTPNDTVECNERAAAG